MVNVILIIVVSFPFNYQRLDRIEQISKRHQGVINLPDGLRESISSALTWFVCHVVTIVFFLNVAVDDRQ